MQSSSEGAVTLPPAQPQYVLRGHASQVHAVAFLRRNSRLLTGDADGWVVLWNVSTKRPTVVWQAHKGPILGLSEWGLDRIITHGRDNHLRVWQLKPEDEESSGFSTTLPVDDDKAHRKQPWLWSELVVNTLTFCAFTFCREELNVFHAPDVANNVANKVNAIYVAVPATKDSEIDVYRMPTERRLSTIPAPSGPGPISMVMALRILFYGGRLLLVAGYESGAAYVFTFSTDSLSWNQVYSSHAHTQPILSLDVAPSLGYFCTSSADDVLARHPLPDLGKENPSADQEPDVVRTKHPGQQSLRIRSDEKIVATAGWDARIRVYSAKTLAELAVFKWHKEGCYAVAFAQVGESSSAGGVDPAEAAAEDVKPSTDLIRVGTGVGEARLTSTTRKRREAKAQTTHWIAAGSKDGKVSLWDVY